MATFKRINGKTPNGGDYAEMYFQDDKGNPVEEAKATRFALRECKKDGTLIFETFGFLGEEDDEDDEDLG